mmetsp:Transcript_40763/g.46507  ORF Transcript_40763/g.46507 Transcript_40763/m.46507 type:complete len:201 (-) Transcript_40763:597-1199(-)
MKYSERDERSDCISRVAEDFATDIDFAFCCSSEIRFCNMVSHSSACFKWFAVDFNLLEVHLNSPSRLLRVILAFAFLGTTLRSLMVVERECTVDSKSNTAFAFFSNSPKPELRNSPSVLPDTFCLVFSSNFPRSFSFSSRVAFSSSRPQPQIFFAWFAITQAFSSAANSNCLCNFAALACTELITVLSHSVAIFVLFSCF